MKALTDVRVLFQTLQGMVLKYVKLYSGFDSYDVLLAFFDFFGSLTLMYWKDPQRNLQGSTRTKPDPIFLTLIKLKLNVNLRNW